MEDSMQTEPDKSVERTLDVGKWRVRGEGGYDVAAVFLKGLRARRFPLMKVEPAEFNARCMCDPDGKIKDDAVLRGVPSCYKEEGGMISLWPSPAHQWTIQIDLTKRGKA